jgi:DNA-binding SARP family transcriptional activator
MRALARSGNTAEALRTYEQLRTLLRDELGIAGCSETLQLHAELLSARVRAAG